MGGGGIGDLVLPIFYFLFHFSNIIKRVFQNSGGMAPLALPVIVCGGLDTEGFFFFFFCDFDACCWVRIIILFEIFLKVWLYVFGKISLLDLIFFSFTIGNFFCWANFFRLAYFVLKFKSIDFFMVFKKKKMIVIIFFTNY